MNTTIINSPEVIDVIQARRAVRKYKDRPVDRSLVEQVVDAGRMAPSAMNRQPWHFYILTSKSLIQTFSKEIARKALTGMAKSGVHGLTAVAAGLLHTIAHGDWNKLKDPVFYGAPVVIFLTAPADNEWAPLDIGMCAENMMLAAKSLGLDSCPIGFAKFVQHAKSYSQLRIPDGENVLLAVILGYGDEKPEMHERKEGNVLYIE